MIDAAARPAPARPLRVSIHAADPARRAVLRRMMFDAGHDIVDTLDAADVVLSDGDYPSNDDRPVVTLGSTRADHAGLLASDADAGQIDAAVRAVANGLIVRAPRSPVSGFATMKECTLETLLTPREVEVLNAIGEGLSNKLIARRLNISLHTVKFHVEALFRKLGVRSRAEAAARAWLRRNEITEL